MRKENRPYSFDDVYQTLQQERLESVGILAAGIAHELGNPLGVIRGRTELLMQSSSESQTKNLNIILGATDRMSKIIRSLQNLSSGLKNYDLQAQPIAPILEESLLFFGELAKSKKVSLHLDINRDLKADCEMHRLRQVMMSLMLNAFDAIEAARHLETEKSETREHSISISAIERLNFIDVQISDTGCGIPESHFNLIFQPFFSTKSVSSHGTGLGLTIAVFLLKEMGASISVTSSQVGKGSTFTVKLKRAQ